MTHRKFEPEICDNKMTFDECEMAILRQVVDESDNMQKRKTASSPEIKKIVQILEDFLVHKKLVCYGGTAVNNILPKSAQFYDKDTEIPDYDFFSKTPMEDAKELADIYHKAGYVEVEAKSGMHFGTFKVFVNFIGIADITLLDERLYDAISKEAINIAGIRYCPPDYLRMAMYLELSRPLGDVSRWEKVMKRLKLLTKYYPMRTPQHCEKANFQRATKTFSKTDKDQIYYVIRNNLIEQGVVFFGGYASALYSRHMEASFKKLLTKNPDFDVLSTEPDRCSMILRERLMEDGFKDVSEKVHPAIGELIPRHIEVMIGQESVAFIYEPISCHSYNTIELGKYEINVATIDTMLSFYLAFMYSGLPYHNRQNILCMAKFLFEVEQRNRLAQKGLLKRFTIKCYGKQQSLDDVKMEKVEKFKTLKPGSQEYAMWFLKYVPGSTEKKKTSKPNKPNKKETEQKQTEQKQTEPNTEQKQRKPKTNKTNKKDKTNKTNKTKPKSNKNKVYQLPYFGKTQKKRSGFLL